MRNLCLLFSLSCVAGTGLAAPGWDAADANAATPASVVPASASPHDPALASGILLAQGVAGGGSPVKTALSEASRVATDGMRAVGNKYLPTFELSFGFAQDNKPVFGILGVIPLYESKDLANTVFSQVSAYRTDERTTVNVGIGNRRLFADERLLVGINAFYDHEFPYSHSRTSIGGEIRSSVAELNANVYQGQSGWKTGQNGLAERAMGGVDVEFGVALPYLPQVKAYGKRFQWNAVDGAADIKGNAFSLRGGFFKGLSVEVGRTYYSGSSQDFHPNANFISLQVDLVKLFDGSQQTRPLLAREAYTFESMKEHRYDKVRRENIIQKQTGHGGFIITASGR